MNALTHTAISEGINSTLRDFAENYKAPAEQVAKLISDHARLVWDIAAAVMNAKQFGVAGYQDEYEDFESDDPAIHVLEGLLEWAVKDGIATDISSMDRYRIKALVEGGHIYLIDNDHAIAAGIRHAMAALADAFDSEIDEITEFGFVDFKKDDDRYVDSDLGIDAPRA